MTTPPDDSFLFDDTAVPLRFERLWRLVGTPGLERLRRTHVLVVGLGGVGSFAAEALARSGVGRLTLVDFDVVCVTNTNRQLHATRPTIGKSKADLMAARLADINPDARIEPWMARVDRSTLEEILNSSGERPDWVADCIDQVDAKVDLIATCHRERIPLVISLGAAARLDPTRVQVADLARTHTDPLGKVVRRKLRTAHNMVFTKEVGIPAVFSDEHPVPPWVPERMRTVGMETIMGNSPPPATTRQVLGSAVFVTSVFGMTLASVIVRRVVWGRP